MSQFTTPLRFEDIDGRLFKILEPFIYHVGCVESQEIITVPKDFITDFASIPRLFYTLVGPPTGRYGKAAVIHDFLYHTQVYTRARSDSIFLEAMKVLRVPWYKRYTMYLTVRSFGWIPWNRHRSLSLSPTL